MKSAKPRDELSTQAIRNPSFAQIVRRHLQPHTITHRQADEVLAHFTGEVSQDFVLVIQLYAEHGARQNRRNGSFQFDRLLAAHRPLTKSRHGPLRK